MLQRAAWQWLLIVAWSLILTACNGVHTLNTQTGAGGAQTEAQQVVSQVYAQAPGIETERLLYSGGDLTRVIERIHARYPQLKPWLDVGAAGNTVGGFIALRDAGREHELYDLIRHENDDRAFLYAQVAGASGHGGDNLGAWFPYVAESFGKEWIAQSPGAWWRRDEKGVWTQGLAKP